MKTTDLRPIDGSSLSESDAGSTLYIHTGNAEAIEWYTIQYVERADLCDDRGNCEQIYADLHFTDGTYLRIHKDSWVYLLDREPESTEPDPADVSEFRNRVLGAALQLLTTRNHFETNPSNERVAEDCIEYDEEMFDTAVLGFADVLNRKTL